MNIRRRLVIIIAVLTLSGVFLSHTYFAAALDSVTKVIASDTQKVTTTIYNNGQTTKVPVTGVLLDKTAMALKVGEIVKLKAVVSPLNATNKNVYWITDNRKVVRVKLDGTVTAIGPGITFVSAITENGNKLAQCLIEVQRSSVIKVPVTGITINKKALTLRIGENAKLNAAVTPSNATYKSYKWITGNSAVATVDNDGVVKGIGKGTVNITAVSSDGNKTAICTVKVQGPAVTGVTLDKAAATLKIKDIVQLKATVKPDNAENTSVTWSSGSNDIASVDATGKVTALKGGKAIITVKTADGGKTAQCTVTVLPPPPVSGVSLNKTKLTLKVKESDKLIAVVKPDNAVSKVVTWVTSNKTIATVDSTGKVTALKVGKAIITVKTANGGKTAQCTVTVLPPPPVSGVSLNKTQLTLKVKKSEKLIAAVKPDNAVSKAVTWVSSNKTIATVDSTGKITALKAGKATITVKTVSGSKIATCVVTVVR